MAVGAAMLVRDDHDSQEDFARFVVYGSLVTIIGVAIAIAIYYAVSGVTT